MSSGHSILTGNGSPPSIPGLDGVSAIILASSLIFASASTRLIGNSMEMYFACIEITCVGSKGSSNGVGEVRAEILWRKLAFRCIIHESRSVSKKLLEVPSDFCSDYHHFSLVCYGTSASMPWINL
ncbi:hypothetical protein E4T48_02077 [Aureobasidium sp. EXF-10727]|nr:hypothetical protein E4T48_02077 [Aureobasidium sp. EXF-10727]